MEETRFWEIVRKINWSYYWRLRDNCEICRQRMLDVCTTVEEQKEFEEKADEMFDKLQDRLTSYFRKVSKGKYDYVVPKSFSKSSYIGEDTLNDGLWHIVGRGKTVYTKVMKSPMQFWKVFGNVYTMMETESFSYIFFEVNKISEDKQIQLAISAIHEQFGVDESAVVAKKDNDMVDVTFDDNHYKIMIWPEDDGTASVQIYKPTFGFDGLINTVKINI